MAAPATIDFECPACNEVTRVPASFAGKKGKCPKCDAKLEVPALPADGKPRPEPEADPDQRPCPHCGETITRTASKCRHCREWLDDKVEAARDEAGPPVHIVLRIWGVFTMVVAGLQTGLLLLALVMAGWFPYGIIITVVMFRLGMGLFRGQRQAVVGMGILGVIAVVFGLWLMTLRGAGGMAAMSIGMALGLYAPPVIVGVRRWSELVAAK